MTAAAPLSREITIHVDEVENTRIHTSCSEPIGPGLVRGDLLVEAGGSRTADETWSGRGRKPEWVKTWLDAGKELAELAIGKD